VRLLDYCLTPLREWVPSNSLRITTINRVKLEALIVLLLCVLLDILDSVNLGAFMLGLFGYVL